MISHSQNKSIASNSSKVAGRLPNSVALNKKACVRVSRISCAIAGTQASADAFRVSETLVGG